MNKLFLSLLAVFASAVHAQAAQSATAPASATTPSSATRAETPEAVLRHIVALIDAGDHRGIFDRYITPEDRAKMEKKPGGFDAVVENFATSKAEELRTLIANALAEPGALIVENDIASLEIGKRKPLRLRRIDGQWYLLSN